MSRGREAQNMWGILTVASWTQCCQCLEPECVGLGAHIEVRGDGAHSFIVVMVLMVTTILMIWNNFRNMKNTRTI